MHASWLSEGAESTSLEEDHGDQVAGLAHLVRALEELVAFFAEDVFREGQRFFEFVQAVEELALGEW